MSKQMLEPCPFCGEKRIFLNEPSQFYRYGSINCPACLVVLPGATSDTDELTSAWNVRAVAQAAPKAECEYCKKWHDPRLACPEYASLSSAQ